MGRGKRARILVVDDDPAYLWLIGSTLDSKGYEVFVAADGPMAIWRTINERPDLVVLDTEMPELDGYEVCRRVREFSTVPIIMLTVFRESANKVKGLNIGADHCLVKPCSFEELVARIEALLRRVAISKGKKYCPLFGQLGLPKCSTTPADLGGTLAQSSQENGQ
jgi:DNA-binding response OmpR family regulator